MLVAWDLYSTQIICTEAHFIKCNSRSLCELVLALKSFHFNFQIPGAEKIRMKGIRKTTFTSNIVQSYVQNLIIANSKKAAWYL